MEPPEGDGVCIACRRPRVIRTVVRVDITDRIRVRLARVRACGCGEVELPSD